MMVISSSKDVDALTLTFVAEFDAEVERVWRLWEDPRQLERWWGPPTWPATFERHEFMPGGQSRYYMTGPDGEKARGWWQIMAVDKPHRLEAQNGHADDDGEPSSTMEPMRLTVTLEPVEGGTRMTVVNQFASTESMDQQLAMQMEEGMRQALSQMDDLLAE
jgi:uncharacterized protein YndB with AHSA1/START domain